MEVVWRDEGTLQGSKTSTRGGTSLGPVVDHGGPRRLVSAVDSGDTCRRSGPNPTVTSTVSRV